MKRVGKEKGLTFLFSRDAKVGYFISEKQGTLSDKLASKLDTEKKIMEINTNDHFMETVTALFFCEQNNFWTGLF